ncbi:MAG: hypothetical protein GEEBNDBF_01064 [bacterium]|nr:hypothetical protein [bacterium]
MTRFYQTPPAGALWLQHAATGLSPGAVSYPLVSHLHPGVVLGVVMLLHGGTAWGAPGISEGEKVRAFDARNLESGYPMPLEDARILAPDTQTISVVFGVPDLLDEYHREYMDIEIHQGLTDRWQVSFTGSLDNVRGNSDGNTAVEAIYLLRPPAPNRAAYGTKLQLDLGSTNDNVRTTITGMISRDVGGLTLHFNGFKRFQEQQGTAVRQELSGLNFGVSSPVRYLFSQPTTGILSLGWEESLARNRRDALLVDAGLRVRGDEGWWWFASVGMNLEQQLGEERPVRVIAGVTWDISR